jgi:3-oxoacyl-[acyl-carrier-protein] synthase-3
MTTTLADVAAYLPERTVAVEELGPELGLTPTQVRVLRRFNGLGDVRRQRPGETLVDLLEGAARALPALRGREHLVRYVIHARGVPVVAPYPVNPVHELCARLGLAGATAFTVTHHACVSGLLAIDIAGRLIARHPDPGALVLVVAGEQVFTLDQRLAPDHRVFGEGAGACLVAAGGPGDAVLSFASAQRSDLDHYAEDGFGAMDRFAAEYTELLGEVILAAVKHADLSLDDIALVLPHNVNVVSWRRVCRRLGLPVDRVLLDNVPLVGHTPSADTFINHASAVALGRLAPGDRYLTAGAGFGAIFSAMVLEHRVAGTTAEEPSAFAQHGSGNMVAPEITDFRRRVVDTLGVLLGRLLGANLPAVSEETRLFDELGLSSSKTLELLLALEDELDIQVDIEEIDRRDLASVGSLSDFVVANADGA